jgi:serine/threonine-protein kinase
VSITRHRAGDVIADKYVVEKVLAIGGMGVVVAAHHRQLKRRVALKFLLAELCSTPGMVDRFLREAQAMTAIQNEHVARVIDVGTTADGTPFMVMEYLEGEDLGQTLDRRGKLPTPEAIDFVIQGMEALAEAHINGVVHRDLKPSNLFVTQRPDGSHLVKVLDFGISKALSVTDDDINLTSTRGLLGSPLYMAPEQIRSSKSVDIRADIWALGIILHQLIAGTSPFAGDNLGSVLAAILSDDPVLLKTVTPEVPEGLSEVLLRCLSRDRDDRYATVADLATALEPFAPPQTKVSIDRIRKTLEHHHRMFSVPDLLAQTWQNNQAQKAPRLGQSATPLQVSRGPISALAQTTPAPSTSPYENSPSTDTDPDTTFGKYKLLAMLGQGGMADVFLAVLGGPEGFGFSKLVVVKRLRSHLASDRELMSMLVDEARIAARLNHPNVIQTHEVGVIDNEYYIAMEYLDGQPLHHILKRTSRGREMSLAFRLGVVRDLLAGVHHAHELVDIDGSQLGLVHRDVTPQNIFVTYDGQVKVVDFGIAKAKGRATETRQGVVKGKLRYMSPEQAGAQEIDRRTDVFAAGVILWELVTGERMWKDIDNVGVIQKLLLDKIPSSARAVNPNVSPALDAIIQKAISRKKTDRYATAQEFQLEIERHMESEGLKCSARELGGWVGELFSNRRKLVQRLVDGQLSKLHAESSQGPPLLPPRDADSGSSSPRRRLDRLDRDPLPDKNPSRPAVLARSDTGRTGAFSSWQRPHSRWMMAGGAALVVVTALVIGNLTRSKAGEALIAAPTTVTGASAPLVNVPASDPSASPAPASAESVVHVSLTAIAPGAEFTIDGENTGKSPVVLTRARDGKVHSITATARGYRSETKSMTFDKDVVWTVPLIADGARVPPRVSPAANSATVTTVNTASPSASSGHKKRELDPDNPYSDQQPPP